MRFSRSIVLVLAFGGVANAAPDTERSPEIKAAAQRYFAAGAKAYAAQNFAAAIASFEEAYAKLPVPEIAFSAAQAYRRQYRVEGKPEYVKRAVELYRIYLDKVKTGGRVGDAADSLGEMQRELDRLQASGVKVEIRNVERTRLGVTIATGDGDATVLREIGDAVGDATNGITATLDGKPLEPFALVDVEPGDHVVKVVAEGFETVETHRRAVLGASDLIDVKLVARPARVTLVTEAATRVMVDGRPYGVMPMGALELVAGKHVITLLRSGREPVARELSVSRGQTIKLEAPLQRTTQRKAVPWVLTSAGALGLGALIAGGVALAADGHASDLRTAIAVGDRPATDADAYERFVRRRDAAVTSTWLLGGAAVVVGAIGVGLYWFDAPSAEGAHLVTIAPVVVGGGGGASISGHW
ncbi:MAG: PEGA domain-containing protein [Proteobacteria bacterium]|nr:PEGA domain-containing protein [Pseudomonadota bacterium]